MNDNTVLRVAHRKGYTVVTNTLAQDRSLSWEARGVMLYLLSHADDWELRPVDLEQCCGRDKVYKILAELIKHRYICREDVRDKLGKRITVAYVIYEEPYPDSPDLAKPDLAKPDSTKYRENQQSKDSKGEPSKPVRKRNLAHDWIVTAVLHTTLEQAERDKTLHSLASKLLTSILVNERMRLDLTPGAPLSYDMQNKIAGHLPGLKAFWLKQHPGLGDSDFPSTPPAFSKVVGQWYAAGCPNGAKPERDPLAAPPMLYDPACPHGCDHGTVHYPDGTSGPCVCQVRIVSELRGTV